MLDLEQWKAQCMAELASRQRGADQAIREQINKIEEQRDTRQRHLDTQVQRMADEKARTGQEEGSSAPIVDKDLLQR